METQDCNTHIETLFALKAHNSKEMRLWQEQRFALFTPEQTRAINQFVRFYVEHGDEFEREAAQEILDNYWASTTKCA